MLIIGFVVVWSFGFNNNDKSILTTTQIGKNNKESSSTHDTDENNILSANIRLNYLGGNRKESIDQFASVQDKDVVYGETNGEIAFNEKFKDTPIFSLTVSYRKNKPNYSSVWALQILNATGAQEYSNDFYNLKTGKIESKYEGIVVPNLSYKIEF